MEYDDTDGTFRTDPSGGVPGTWAYVIGSDSAFNNITAPSNVVIT